jgi:hypothetical protein
VGVRASIASGLVRGQRRRRRRRRRPGECAREGAWEGERRLPAGAGREQSGLVQVHYFFEPRGQKSGRDLLFARAPSLARRLTRRRRRQGGGATRTATRTTIHAETGEDGARSIDRSIVPRGKAVPTS